MALRRHVLALRLEWPFALSGIFLYLGYSVVVVDLLLLFFTLSELQNASAVKIIADNFVFKKKKKCRSIFSSKRTNYQDYDIIQHGSLLLNVLIHLFKLIKQLQLRTRIIKIFSHTMMNYLKEKIG